MSHQYRIALFQDKEGNIPFRDYLFDGSNEKDVAVILDAIGRLQRIGLAINGTNMGDRLEGPINELRKDRHRIIYAVDGNLFIILGGFLKKTQKTPPEQIKLAKDRFKEYQETGRCIPLVVPNLD